IAADALATHLREYMVRTERPREAAIKALGDAAPDLTRVPLRPQDVNVVRHLLKLHDDGVSRGLRAHRAVLVELWKSIPYPLTFTQRYQAGKAFVDPKRRDRTWPAALTAAVRQESATWDGGHARLSAATRLLGHDLEERLWLAPTQPYVAATSGL